MRRVIGLLFFLVLISGCADNDVSEDLDIKSDTQNTSTLNEENQNKVLEPAIEEPVIEESVVEEPVNEDIDEEENTGAIVEEQQNQTTITEPIDPEYSIYLVLESNYMPSYMKLPNSHIEFEILFNQAMNKESVEASITKNFNTKNDFNDQIYYEWITASKLSIIIESLDINLDYYIDVTDSVTEDGQLIAETFQHTVDTGYQFSHDNIIYHFTTIPEESTNIYTVEENEIKLLADVVYGDYDLADISENMEWIVLGEPSEFRWTIALYNTVENELYTWKEDPIYIQNTEDILMTDSGVYFTTVYENLMYLDFDTMEFFMATELIDWLKEDETVRDINQTTQGYIVTTQSSVTQYNFYETDMNFKIINHTSIDEENKTYALASKVFMDDDYFYVTTHDYDTYRTYKIHKTDEKQRLSLDNYRIIDFSSYGMLCQDSKGISSIFNASLEEIYTVDQAYIHPFINENTLRYFSRTTEKYELYEMDLFSKNINFIASYETMDMYIKVFSNNLVLTNLFEVWERTIIGY